MKAPAKRSRRAAWLLAAAFIAGSALAASIGDSRGDGWSRAELSILASMRLGAVNLASLDPSNAYESSPAASRLGQRIFSDTRFSGNGAVSCASCHQPDKQFQDGRPLGQGIGTGKRRTMPIAGASRSPFLMWDGRKDSLWSQALGPFEDAAEHGGNRLAYAHLVDAHYRKDYEAVFGQMPDLSRLPWNASPVGTPEQQVAWNALSASEQRDVSRVFANMGKALAAYEKSLQHGESRLDRYLGALADGDPGASSQLSAREKNGLRIFIGKGSCVTCHTGPLFTDQAFHNTGIAPRVAGQPDLGRRAGIAKLRADEFNCLGQFSDAKPDQCTELNFLADDEAAATAAFKTPSLRDVARRAPYMHAGQLASLDEVMRHYRRAPRSAAGHSELKPVRLSESEVADVVAFLGTLNQISQQ
ncbi:cytochrome c peroxidase [Massilia terrae]|uniref:Cytochrome-c peroxidase n=1 Tax=Massilia terrae TaxID=1811224 RepID=A0ABT2CUJ3_9BURK|nr:cytochrome c peroxidase [Massilia terrae]MCS0657642.1 cytochrome-c peroxidase [Massilia terrae]